MFAEVAPTSTAHIRIPSGTLIPEDGAILGTGCVQACALGNTAVRVHLNEVQGTWRGPMFAPGEYKGDHNSESATQ